MSTNVRSPVKKRPAKKVDKHPYIEDKNETTLRKYNFIPEKKIILEGSDIRRMGYLSRSPMGYYVFVEAPSSSDDSTVGIMYQETKPFHIPHSTKKGVFEEVGESVIFTSEGVCRLGRKQNTTEMEEVCFSSPLGDNRETIHPIVRLGEIVANVALVHSETSKKISRLRRWNYDAVNTSIANLQREQDRNRDLFVKFLQEQTETATKLSNVIKELQNYMQVNYTKDDPLIGNVRRNLEYANDKSLHFLQMCSETQKMCEQMNEMNIKLENINKTLRNDFRDVNVFKEV